MGNTIVMSTKHLDSSRSIIILFRFNLLKIRDFVSIDTVNGFKRSKTACNVIPAQNRLNRDVGCGRLISFEIPEGRGGGSIFYYRAATLLRGGHHIKNGSCRRNQMLFTFNWVYE